MHDDVITSVGYAGALHWVPPKYAATYAKRSDINSPRLTPTYRDGVSGRYTELCRLVKD